MTCPQVREAEDFPSAACSKNTRNYLELSWKSTTCVDSTVTLDASSGLGSFRRRPLSANFYFFWQA